MFRRGKWAAWSRFSLRCHALGRLLGSLPRLGPQIYAYVSIDTCIYVCVCVALYRSVSKCCTFFAMDPKIDLQSSCIRRPPKGPRVLSCHEISHTESLYPCFLPAPDCRSCRTHIGVRNSDSETAAALAKRSETL